MAGDVFMWIVGQHVLAHCLLALILMLVLCTALQLAGVYAFAWHAAGYVTVFFYAREAAQAERALKPLLGDPLAFFWTLWPGNWSAGGARLWEWLAPTLVVLAIAAVTPRRPALRGGPEINVPGEGRSRERR